MSRPAPIRIDTDTWAVMRDATDHPAALIHRVTDTSGDARYLVMVWHVQPSQRRMSGIYQTIRDADDSVKYDMTAVREAHRKNAGSPNGRSVNEEKRPRTHS